MEVEDGGQAKRDGEGAPDWWDVVPAWLSGAAGCLHALRRQCALKQFQLESPDFIHQTKLHLIRAAAQTRTTPRSRLGHISQAGISL